MKILWTSDSPTTPSEFGNVTRAVCAGLAGYGHQVSILGWQTRSQVRWHKCTLYPFDLQNNPTLDDLLGYLREIRPDVVVMLGEISRLPGFHHPIIANFLRTAGISWALYYPIDGDLGERRLLRIWVDLLQTVELPIAMSRYGAQVSLANGVRSAYIPFGVDTRVFHPPANKELAKQALGYGGHFVILADARNHPRTQLPRTLEIFRRFAAEKDDVLLHLHCDPDDPLTRTSEYGYDLRSEIAELGLTSKVRLSPGISISLMPSLRQVAKLYQAADVHLLSSWGEGFGLSTLQAAAAGVVPMAADYAASRELVEGHGEAIRVHHFWPSPFGLRRAFIDIDDAVSKLEQLYRDRERLLAKAEQAHCFAQAYDWEYIVSQWHELLQRQVLPTVRYPWLRVATLQARSSRCTSR